MASSNASTSAQASSRSVSLPAIPELLNPNFRDVLLPAKPAVQNELVDVSSSSNPMMDALKASSQRTFTSNGAAAFSGTDSPTLDAFSSLSRYTSRTDLEQYLEKAWNEDADLTLRIIWNLRSIHDGKAEKEAFYRAFGWLYDNHPRTAISNLHMLVNPTCRIRNKKSGASHGYWKDLLNILALATVDELTAPHSKFLHSEREKFTYPSRHRVKGIPSERIEASLANDARNKERATKARHTRQEQNHQRLIQKLSQPKFRALYIAVARLFSEQLIKDVKVMHSARELGLDQDKIAFLKQLSLAAKWAPTPGGSHDRVTNISTAIVEIIYAAQVMSAHPSVLNTPLDAEKRAQVLRSFFQRWVLTELRRAAYCIEPLMAAKRWKEIKYNRVSSICMKNNTETFFKHDPEGFQDYLISVEQGKKKISGATLLPHELVAQVIKLSVAQNRTSSKFPALQEVKKKLAETEARVAEAQWKTLISNLRESGTIENSIAVCDVSGSMGSIYDCARKGFGLSPILPAISLSLVLASLAKPPFNGGFITFSQHPQFVTLDLNTPLKTQIDLMASADWGMNTDFSAVFLKLLLPLAIENKVKQEDMIKRIFVFSDMQFESAGKMSDWKWKTNHDAIEKAYKDAGYEVPQIVYWDLSASGKPTKEAQDSGREGVAMMNGFSPAMMKVFMGEEEDAMEWEKITEGGESATVVEAEAFNPVNVMKKALLKQSFDGLVVVD